MEVTVMMKGRCEGQSGTIFRPYGLSELFLDCPVH